MTDFNFLDVFRMRKLQLFAEGEGDDGGAGDGNDGGSGKGGGNNHLSFDDFLKLEGNQAEFDRRISKATNTAVANAQEKWQALADKNLSEAEKLAKMTKEEKAEYKTKKLEKELADLKRQNAVAELEKGARKLLTEQGLNIPDEILTKLVGEDAEATKTSVDAFTKMFNEAVNEAVKSKARQKTPGEGGGSSGGSTTVDIAAMAKEARIIK